MQHLKLEDDHRAKALIELVEGSVSHGIVNVLQNYSYVVDESDSLTYWLGEVAEGIGLRFSPEYTTVLILGDSMENVENANYVLNRGGWDSAVVTVATPTIEEQILGSFASLAVTDTIRVWEKGAPASSLPPIANLHSAPAFVLANDHPLEVVSHPVFTAAATPPSIPQASPASQAAAGDIDALRAEIEFLRRQLADRPVIAGDHGRLVPIFESLMLSQLEQVFNSNDLVRQLNDAGYALTLRIVPRSI